MSREFEGIDDLEVALRQGVQRHVGKVYWLRDGTAVGIDEHSPPTLATLVFNGFDTSTNFGLRTDGSDARPVPAYSGSVYERLDRIERMLEDQERRRIMAEYGALTRAWRGPR